MIIRRNKLNIKAKDVSFMMSFGPADVRRFLKDFFCSCSTDDVEFFRGLSLKESDLRYWMEHDPFAFAVFETPWREQLSGWLWNQWLAAGYFVKSASQDGVYFFSEKALALVEKSRKK